MRSSADLVKGVGTSAKPVDKLHGYPPLDVARTLAYMDDVSVGHGCVFHCIYHNDSVCLRSIVGAK